VSDISIIGAGGLGKEVAGLVAELQYSLLGFYDDDPDKKTLGNISEVGQHSQPLAIAVGDSQKRIRIVQRLNIDWDFPNLIHPRAYLQNRESIQLGKGSILCAGSVFTTDIIIGDFSIINLSCTIGHDVVIGDFCSLMPSVNLSGNVKLGKGVFIGTGATILPGITIGENTVIGAGAVVTKDIGPDQKVIGVPAKPIQ